MASAAASGTANGARPSVTAIATAAAPATPAAARISRHGCRVRSSAGPSTGPVSSCGNVDAATRTPAWPVDPVRSSATSTSASASPSFSNRASDALATKRSSNVFKR